MAQSDNIAPLQAPTPVSEEDLEIARVLEQSRRDADAGLSLKGADARAYLKQIRDRARARVSRQSR
jgi:hypothetical protein